MLPEHIIGARTFWFSQMADTIRTKNYSQPGGRWSSSMLGKSGGKWRTNSCSLRILLKRPAGRQQQQVVQEPNSNDRGGRCWTNNRSWNRVLSGNNTGSIVRCTNKEKNGDLSAGGGGQCKKTKSGKVWCWTKGRASGNTLCKRPGSYGGYYWPIPSQTVSELKLGRHNGPNRDCATNYFTGRGWWTGVNATKGRLEPFTGSMGAMRGGGNERLTASEGFSQKGVGTLL